MNFSEKYAIILSYPEKELNFAFIKLEKEAEIKNDYLNFSSEEKKLFNLIQNAQKWKEKIDEEEVLDLLDKISFKIIYKSEKLKELSFSNEKISAELKIIKEGNFPQKANDLIFKISEKNILFFKLTSKAIFAFTENKIHKIETENLELLNIIKRAALKKYSKNEKKYSQYFETSFSNEEILKINQFQKELEKLFILNSQIEKKYEIIEIKNQKEVIEIYYSHKDRILEIKPFYDYELKKIPISEAIFIKKEKDGYSFKRKFNDDFGIDFLIKIDEGKIFWTKINYEKEINFFKHLFALKNELGLNSKLILSKKGERQIKSFLEKNWKVFKTLPFEKKYLKEKIDFEKINFKADIEVDLQNSKNLLNLKADFYLGKNKISLEELKDYSLKKGNLITDSEGKLLKIENSEELKRLLLILKRFKKNEELGLYQGKLYHITELQNIFQNSKFYKTQINQGLKNFLTDVKKYKNKPAEQLTEEIKIPEKFEKILRKYQISGIEWMYFLKKYNFGGILADDMGLGKTIQTLILLAMEKSENPSIVITPKTLINNWKSEAEKFTPNLKVLIIDGSWAEREKKIKEIKKYNLILTSYSMLQRDIENYQENEIQFNYVILDEAQYIKNFKTKNAVAVKQLDSKYRLALSGTPLENSINEIWSIYEFLMPSFLGTYSEFTKKYIKPITSGDRKKLNELQEKISIFMLRRLKSDVLKELPPKIEQKLFVELSSDQKILYTELLSKIKKEFGEKLNQENYGKSYIHILAALTRLRQVCNHPNLILKDKDYKKYNSEKLNLFNNLINEIVAENRKVLVFSQFTSMLDILESEIKNNEYEYYRLDGKTKNRNEIIEKFNSEKDTKIFLISLKAGGVGLNLTSADSVIIFDPWWNPSTENQAIDRAHRIGQKKSVNVYKIITKDTIEEKILTLQKEKKSLFDSIVNKNELDFKTIKWDDLAKLFEI